MLWLCLHFPRLPLEVFTRAVPETGPFAVSTGRGSRRSILMASPEAEAAGIRPGMALGTAYAHASGLVVRERDEASETAALTGLASWAGQFTSLVSLSPFPFPALLLEVEGSLSLFRGLERLVETIEEGIERLGYRSFLGLAPTPLAAELLARHGRGGRVTEAGRLEGSLAGLPIGVLDPAAAQALWGVGLRTVGECLGLPRAGLARRFGRDLPEALDRALGRVPDPRPAVSLPARFESRLELPVEVWDAEPLLFSAQRLLSELEGFLRARGSGVRRISLDLCHREQVHTRIELSLTAPRRSARHLLALLRERLGRTALPEPVVGLCLAAGALVPLLPRNQDLFSKDRACPAGEEMPQLVERLQARLGLRAVQGLRIVPEHRPERAYRSCPPLEGGEAPAAPTGGRPLWLLPEPALLPALRRSEVPEHLALVAGPERIESGWWDGADVTRDYYVAEAPRGCRLWVFRERRGERRWFVHGIFG